MTSSSPSRLDAIARGQRRDRATIYEAREFGKALREVMRIADRVNEYFDQAKPWELAKDPARRARAAGVCTTRLHAFRDADVLPGAGAAGARRRASRRCFGMSTAASLGRHRATPPTHRSAVQAPDGAHRPEADRRAARAARRRTARPRRPRPQRRRAAATGADSPSRSTTSPRSTCASRDRQRRARRRRRQAAEAHARRRRRPACAPCSRASSPPTSPRTWSAG